MYFEYYQNFVSIIDSGTISAAAKKLHIAQPALSNQIKALEDKYGAQLVVRGPRSLSLTENGRILYENAKVMCVLEDATTRDIQAQLLGYQGTLQLGSIGTQPEKLSASMLLKFHEMYPNISYRIHEGSSLDVMRMLKDGIVEAGFLRSRDPLPSYLKSVYSVPSNYMVCFSAANNRLNNSEAPISLVDLRDIPLSVAGGIYPRFTQVCSDAGFTPKIVSICTSVVMTKIWAHSSDTGAIFSSPSCECEEGLRCRIIDGAGLTTTHYICYNKERAQSAALKAFIEFVKNDL